MASLIHGGCGGDGEVLAMAEEEEEEGAVSDFSGAIFSRLGESGGFGLGR